MNTDSDKLPQTPSAKTFQVISLVLWCKDGRCDNTSSASHKAVAMLSARKWKANRFKLDRKNLSSFIEPGLIAIVERINSLDRPCENFQFHIVHPTYPKALTSTITQITGLFAQGKVKMQFECGEREVDCVECVVATTNARATQDEVLRALRGLQCLNGRSFEKAKQHFKFKLSLLRSSRTIDVIVPEAPGSDEKRGDEQEEDKSESQGQEDDEGGSSEQGTSGEKS